MESDILSAIGDLDALETELEEYRKSAEVLSSDLEHLIARYPKRWVAIYRGKVAASAPTLPELIDAIAEEHLPQGHVIIRYIDKNFRKMIL